jgi:hypothetical protein
MAGNRPELSDLGVGPGEVLRRGLEQHPDSELSQSTHDVVRVAGEDDEIGAIAGDRLDVRRVTGETRMRSALRVVGLIVDGDDLGAGADREQ